MGSTPLILAARRGRDEVLRILVEERAAIDYERPDGFTALMSAANYGQIGALNVLLKAGTTLIFLSVPRGGVPSL